MVGKENSQPEIEIQIQTPEEITTARLSTMTRRSKKALQQNADFEQAQRDLDWVKIMNLQFII